MAINLACLWRSFGNTFNCPSLEQYFCIAIPLHRPEVVYDFFNIALRQN